MIHTTDNFFNKLITEVRAVYFAKENHTITDYYIAKTKNGTKKLQIC